MGFTINKRRQKTKRMRKCGTQSVEEDPRFGLFNETGVPVWVVGRLERPKKQTGVKQRKDETRLACSDCFKIETGTSRTVFNNGRV